MGEGNVRVFPEEFVREKELDGEEVGFTLNGADFGEGTAGEHGSGIDALMQDGVTEFVGGNEALEVFVSIFVDDDYMNTVEYIMESEGAAELGKADNEAKLRDEAERLTGAVFACQTICNLFYIFHSFVPRFFEYIIENMF